MSQETLYRVAQERVDARRRRWLIWSIDLGILLLSVAVLIVSSTLDQPMIGPIFLIAWTAIFIPHTIMVGLAESRSSDIENEVKLLREGLVAYEKPKREVAAGELTRVELGEDGELVEVHEPDAERQTYKRRGDSL